MKLSFPVSCEWLITERCNMHCFFCSACSDTKRQDYLYSDDELNKIINNIKKSGCLYVSLSGGEPLLHKQFFDILSLLKQNSFIITLTSNGTLIDENVVVKLHNSGLKWAQVTLLSSDEETHNKIMGKGSFTKVIKAIKLLRQYNIGVTICYTKSIDNTDEIAVRKIAKQLNTEITIRNTLSVGFNHIKNNYIDTNKIKMVVQDRNSFALMPDGDLKTCSESDLIFGNIFEDDIENMWRNNKGFGKCLKNDYICLAELSLENQKLAKMQLEMV